MIMNSICNFPCWLPLSKVKKKKLAGKVANHSCNSLLLLPSFLLSPATEFKILGISYSVVPICSYSPAPSTSILTPWQPCGGVPSHLCNRHQHLAALTPYCNSHTLNWPHSTALTHHWPSCKLPRNCNFLPAFLLILLLGSQQIVARRSLLNDL